jgi:hypothetical protein
MPEQCPRCPVGRGELRAALGDRADDRGAEPLAQGGRDGALQSRPGFEHARQRLMLALDRSRGQLGLDGRELAGECSPALGCLLCFAPGPLMHLAGLSQRGTDLLLGPLKRVEGRLRRHSALLGLLGLEAQACALLGGIRTQLLELDLEFRDPSRSRSLVRLLLQRIQPELALAEGAP